MSGDVLTDWRGRYSRLFKGDGKWRIYVPSTDGAVHSRAWRWWNPAHLVRMVLHRSWARRYF
jgi:hypothetical protein